MKIKFIYAFSIISLLAITLVGAALAQTPMGTAFTYQGFLKEGGNPASGDYDFEFYLFAEPSGGDPVWDPMILDAVKVSNGLFNVQLDYESEVFIGEARWLEIWVRQAGKGEHTQLTPRQPLTPAPYSLFSAQATRADQAGSIAWTNIFNRPSGLDDGDDDTTYSAGLGLELDGTEFNVVNPPLAERVTAPANVTVTQFAGASAVPQSVTIGIDGLPLISYSGSTTSLEVAHCEDVACSSATYTSLDSGGLTTSITIGSNGMGVISYYDGTALKLALCENIECSSAIIRTLDSSVFTLNTSVTIGVDGFPIISYGNDFGPQLKVTHCNEPNCTTWTNTTFDVPGGDLVLGLNASLTIGSDGLPLISYTSEGGGVGSLLVAHCNDVVCSTATHTNVDWSRNLPVDSGFMYTSVTLGNDGMGLISYYDYGDTHLKVAHCDNIICDTVTSNILDGNIHDPVGMYTSITIGTDGLGLISYYDQTNGDLKVAHCNNTVCSSAAVTTLHSRYREGENLGLYTSVSIGSDGMPVISYYDEQEQVLWLAQCSNNFCIPYFRRR